MRARIGTALLLGLATALLISAALRLPYSPTRDAITDALTLPGGLFAGAFYPQGIHTGAGSPNWALLAIIGNLIAYTLFWYIVLEVLNRRPRARGT